MITFYAVYVSVKSSIKDFGYQLGLAQKALITKVNWTNTGEVLVIPILSVYFHPFSLARN